jgi:hypothetical protein
LAGFVPGARVAALHAIEAEIRGHPAEHRLPAKGYVLAASSLNSVAVRSKRVISIGLPIGLLSMRIDVTRRENPTQADLSIRPSEEAIFSAAGITAPNREE